MEKLNLGCGIDYRKGWTNVDFNKDVKAKEQIKEKKYPEDYTKEQREMIKKIVIARIKQMPSNIRLSIG